MVEKLTALLKTTLVCVAAVRGTVALADTIVVPVVELVISVPVTVELSCVDRVVLVVCEAVELNDVSEVDASVCPKVLVV